MADLILKGNTTSQPVSGTFKTQLTNQPYVINDFLITNKTGGVVTLNVQIFDGNQTINIAPFNLQLAQSNSYGDQGFVLQEEEQLIIIASGSCDYYIDLTQIISD